MTAKSAPISRHSSLNAMSVTPAMGASPTFARLPQNIARAAARFCSIVI